MPRCPGARKKVATRARTANLERATRCPDCGRTIAINYDGTIRRHVDKPKRGN